MPKLDVAIDIRWREVESSNVRAIGWDNANGMYVLFHHGGLYLYKDVTRQRAVACFRAESVGKYLHKHILNSFKATKIA